MESCVITRPSPRVREATGVIERQEKFCPLPLAFFPQSKGFLHGVLFRVQPSAFNCAAGESLLIRGEVYVHRLQNTEKPCF